jgi:hypothetical protein
VYAMRKGNKGLQGITMLHTCVKPRGEFRPSVHTQLLTGGFCVRKLILEPHRAAQKEGLDDV